MLREPCLHTAADECLGDGVVLDERADQHHSARQQGCEADTHLVEDDSGEDEEENEHVEEGLCSLHRAERGGVPSAGRLHQILDRRQNVHEDVGTEHRHSQQQ